MSTREVLFSDPNGSLPPVQRRTITEEDTPVIRGQSFAAETLVTVAADAGPPVVEEVSSIVITPPATSARHLVDLIIDDTVALPSVTVILSSEGRQEGDTLNLHIHFVTTGPTDVTIEDDDTEPNELASFVLGTVADEYDAIFVFTDGAWVRFGQATHLITS